MFFTLLPDQLKREQNFNKCESLFKRYFVEKANRLRLVVIF